MGSYLRGLHGIMPARVRSPPQTHPSNLRNGQRGALAQTPEPPSPPHWGRQPTDPARTRCSPAQKLHLAYGGKLAQRTSNWAIRPGVVVRQIPIVVRRPPGPGALWTRASSPSVGVAGGSAVSDGGTRTSLGAHHQLPAAHHQRYLSRPPEAPVDRRRGRLGLDPSPVDPLEVAPAAQGGHVLVLVTPTVGLEA